MSVTKSTAERYAVHTSGGEYASIVLRDWSRPVNIDQVRTTTYYCGEIQIHSSFGSWANTWTACGVPFKQFLLGAEFEYLFIKFMGTKFRVFDGEASFKSLVEKVLRDRREGGIGKEEARDIYGDLDDAQEELEAGSDSFVNTLFRLMEDRRGRAFKMFAEPWDLIVRKPDCQAVGFWREIWPEFTAALREELVQPVPA